ncbi:MAG: molybdate ABC transporter substrate-binding protein, partial [Pseudomonadota bacterium]
EARTQTPIEVFYSKSSDLARRIASGASVDLFVTGDIEWATWLQAQGFVRAEDRLTFASDRLVMIAPENSPVEPVPAVELLLSEWRDSEELLGLADPERNGAGLRARNVLTAFQDIVGPLDALEGRLALAEDRAVLKRLVKRGELGLAITYLTEAKSADGVKVVARFDPADHQPILAVAARTKLGNAEADSFLAFLGSPEAQTVLMRAGFEAP